MALITYNLTPHSVDICNEEDKRIGSIKPSGLIVRAQMEESVWRTLGSSKVPVWEIQVTKPTVINESLSMKIGKTEEIFIIVSRTAADAIMSDNESTNVMWDWVWEGVRLINVVTPHKSQFNRVTNERYGALGLALQGQIGR
ncbi:hypothetical protein OAA43_00275 [bacterium]|nr:hypothetical protein [bacterium]